MTEDHPNSGRWCVQMPMERGKNHGGDAIKWFLPRADAVHAQCCEKTNCFWLEHYGYDDGDPTKQYWKASQAVWFGDVVAARRYIGPIAR